MYVTGRWVSANAVGTMFIAWILGVITFLAFVYWQRRKNRRRPVNRDRHRKASRSRTSRKTGQAMRLPTTYDRGWVVVRQTHVQVLGTPRSGSAGAQTGTAKFTFAKGSLTSKVGASIGVLLAGHRQR